MKRPFMGENKYLLWGLTAFLVIICSIVFFLIVSRLSIMRSIFDQLMFALSPIFFGLVFAYFLNKLTIFFEIKFLNRAGTLIYPKNTAKAKRASRTLSILLGLICTVVLIGGTLSLVIPQIITSVKNLVDRFPAYYQTVVDWTNRLLVANPNQENAVAESFKNAIDGLQNWLNTGLLEKTNQIILSITTGVFSVVETVISIFIGLIFSIYLLSGKEKIKAQAKRLLYGSFNSQRANRILHYFRFLDKTVGGFFLGKIIESLIVGFISYLFLVIFDMPFPVLIAVLLGLTNLIPFFGSFIGAIPSTLMILLENPLKCLVFVIFIIILHPFATHILSPRVQVETIGLSGFWVLFSILLFGGLFGFWGLLLGVPIFAVIFAGIAAMNKSRLEKKCYPVTTDAYENLSSIDPETGVAEYFPDDTAVKNRKKGRRLKKDDK